jgi:hypothetical protein
MASIDILIDYLHRLRLSGEPIISSHPLKVELLLLLIRSNCVAVNDCDGIIDAYAAAAAVQALIADGVP